MEHMENEHLFECALCRKTFRAKSQLNQHMGKDHAITCDVCNSVVQTEEELKKHKVANHHNPCCICSQVCETDTELEEHLVHMHPYMCRMCKVENENKVNHEQHMLSHHTYTCDVCQLVVTGEESMEDHILDKHALPDSDNKFSCDDCTFQTEDKKNFGKHYKENHGHQAAKIVTGVKSAATEANEKMRRDLKELKNNFERLELMYHESLENVNQVKSEYEAKLILANDNFTVIKAENEVLKEKVDVLFKLGRSYLNNMQKPKEDSKTKVQAWTRNKMRGFKRVDP